jgi:hypothetical protein
VGRWAHSGCGWTMVEGENTQPRPANTQPASIGTALKFQSLTTSLPGPSHQNVLDKNRHTHKISITTDLQNLVASRWVEISVTRNPLPASRHERNRLASGQLFRRELSGQPLLVRTP